MDETEPATQPATPASGPIAGPAPAIPETIHRFQVKSKLGEGGNGVVLLALDPTLGRNVAIKMMRRAGDPAANQRLLREAQSVARINHDNVIVVHEVGTFEDAVFVAMELVGGGSLAAWQDGKPWRECLESYVRAGRGLVAAHAAGLVHRDFKPENVLVGDGRLRVTDFGLVSVAGAEVTAPDSGELAAVALGTSLTRTGMVMGTPRYMAPEQHRGEAVDARADQFAFCVALYEALYQCRPFPGATYPELAERVLMGDITPPPAESPVPPAVRDAILRGLSRDRDARFPSMTELLEALTAGLAPVSDTPHRRLWTVVVAAAAIAIAVAVWFPSREPANPESPPMTTFATADEAYQAGEIAYHGGDFERAIEAFKYGFALAPDLDKKSVAYLYNIAQAYRQLRKCAESASAFKKFLALKNDLAPQKRADLEAKVQDMEACARQQAEESGP